MLRSRRSCRASNADIRVEGECKDGQEAIEFISRVKPDIIFLIFRCGSERVRCAEYRHLSGTSCYFTTAYDHYNQRAFELHAIDFLLKPLQKR